ncbi:hypothetical protein BJ741DRAFT_583331 [Chytriomyces cf. hyalinus JEL632]|nr:hypothetical protein BJ741DRAFT_583331 [Chytriomyces cf. hyalinus JEL632]
MANRKWSFCFKTSNNYSLSRLSKSLDIAKTLFLDRRVKNGELFLSVARGDVDPVTKYLHLSANSNLADPNKISVYMQELSTTNVCSGTAVGQSWKVFRNLIGHPRSNLLQKKWNLYKLLCSGYTFEDDKLEAFKAFVSREAVKEVRDHARWRVPLQLACEIGASNILEYVLAEGYCLDVNCSDVIGPAIKHARTRDGGDQILSILASHKSFRSLDKQETGHLIKQLCAPTSPLAKYVLSKDQRCFFTCLLAEGFNGGCELKMKGVVKILIQLPGIQVRHSSQPQPI